MVVVVHRSEECLQISDILMVMMRGLINSTGDREGVMVSSSE